MKKIKLYTIIFGAVLVSTVLGFVIWSSLPIPAEPGALAIALSQTDNFQVAENETLITISRKDAKPTIGIIYYPGARITPNAYISKLSPLVAEDQNIEVFITKPFINFAFFGINDAAAIIAANKAITDWYVGGHSLGGAMACQFAGDHKAEIKGLLLFGSYCANDLSQSGLKVLSISGTLDALSTPEKIANSKKNLPSDAEMVEIVGANHSQMGNYGLQNGDNTATSEDTETRRQLVRSLQDFLR